MSKEEYNNLLKIRDEILNHNVEYDAPSKGDPPPPVLEPESLPEYPFEPVLNELNTILESKIFQDGQLRGRQLTGHARKYKGYQINDLEEFIWLLCKKMNDFYPIDFDRQIEYSLGNLVDAINGCGNSIREIFGKREYVQVAKLREKIEAWLKAQKDLFPNILSQSAI